MTQIETQIKNLLKKSNDYNNLKKQNKDLKNKLKIELRYRRAACFYYWKSKGLNNKEISEKIGLSKDRLHSITQQVEYFIINEK